MCLLCRHNLTIRPDVFWFGRSANGGSVKRLLVNLLIQWIHGNLDSKRSCFYLRPFLLWMILDFFSSWWAKIGLVSSAPLFQSPPAAGWYREIWSRSRHLTWNLCLSLSPFPFLRRRWFFCADNDGFDCGVPRRFPSNVWHKLWKSESSFVRCEFSTCTETFLQFCHF